MRSRVLTFVFVFLCAIAIPSWSQLQGTQQLPGSPTNAPFPGDKLVLEVYGSSTPFGTGASQYSNSVIGKLATGLAALSQPWTVINYASNGNTTSGLLSDIKAHALKSHPTAVLLMPSLGNESLSNIDTAVATFRSNMQQAIQLCRAQGIYVFLGTAPPRYDTTTVTSTYGATTLQQVQQALTSEMESWQGAQILVDGMNTLGDGAGQFLAAYDSGDHIHANDTGHAAMYNSIPLTRFNNLHSWNWGSVMGLSRQGAKTPSASSTYAWRVYLANATSGSWAASFWMKLDQPPISATYLGWTSSQTGRLSNAGAGTVLVGGSGTSTNLPAPFFQGLSDLGWHHFVLSYRAQDTKYWLYQDDKLVLGPTVDNGFITTALDIVQIGFRVSTSFPTLNTWFKDFALYLRPLWQQDVDKLYRGQTPWGGLDCYLRLEGPNSIGVRSPNAASTDTFAVAGESMAADPGPVVPSGASGLHTSLPNVSAESFPRGQNASADLACLTSGQLYLVAVDVKEPTTVNSITFMSGGTAAAGLTHAQFGVFDSALVPVCSTGDQGAMAWGTNTVKTLSVSTPTWIPAGLYYVGVYCTGTTMPTLRGLTGNTNLANVAPILYGTSTGSLVASMPNPAAAITVASSLPYCALK